MYQDAEKDIRDYFQIGNTIIIVINVVVFLLGEFGSFVWEGAEELFYQGALYAPAVRNGEYYRLLTSFFLHSGIEHILWNMVLLWFMGGTLEKRVGTLRYICLYFGSGILAAVMSVSCHLITGQEVYCVGASGAIFGVVGAILYILFVRKERMDGLTSGQIILFCILNIGSSLTDSTIDNAAHIGGFLAGILLAFALYWNKAGREDRNGGITL